MKKNLRTAAEAELARRAPQAADQPALLHELQVHQIELEMQNQELRRVLLELEKSRDRYEDFYDFAPVGYLSLNREGLIEEINLAGAALLGVERGKLLRQGFTFFVAAEDRDRWHHYFRDALGSTDILTFELALQRLGSAFYARLDCLRLKSNRLRIVLTDITGRKLAEETERNREEFFRMIAENVEDFIAVLDLKGRRLYNSPSYARLFGDTDALKGTDSFAEIHPDDLDRVRRSFRQTVRTGASHRLNFRFVLKDGSIRHMESCGGLIRDSQGRPLRVVVVSRDITERIKDEEVIRNLAFYDTLTQLPNRRLLADRIDQAMAASQRSRRYGALLFLDLDNFKPLNDAHGHKTGDLLLVEVARRISGCVREMDTVARYGGDEFVVVLSELDTDRNESIAEIRRIAEKIRAMLAEPYRLESEQQGVLEHCCTSSIGVALFADHQLSDQDILKQADMAMYQAKVCGRNMIRFFDPIPGGA